MLYYRNKKIRRNAKMCFYISMVIFILVKIKFCVRPTTANSAENHRLLIYRIKIHE